MNNNNNPKIITCNLIVVVMAITAIITLCVGNFFSVKVTFNINEELLSNFVESNGEGEEAPEIEYEKLFAGIDIKIPLSMQIKNATLLKSLSGNASEAVQTLITEQIDSVLTNLFNIVDEVVAGLTTALINTVVEQAKEEVIESLKESLGTDDVTNEQVMQELESQYGITETEIESLQTDITNTMLAMLNGGTNEVSQTLQESETLDNLVAVYAEQALTEELGEGSYTQQQIDAKAAELKGEIIDNFDSSIEDLSIEGDFNKESIVVWIFNQIDPESSTPISDLDGVKDFLADMLFNSMDDSAVSAISTFLKGFGVFLLIIILSWAYVAFKILIKLFARNKTVGMFAPKFFGWMPYVIFVGIPSILFGNLVKFINLLSSRMNIDPGTLDAINQYSSWITIKFSSITWVSALLALLLMILWFPYHKWRKEEKQKKRNGGQQYYPNPPQNYNPHPPQYPHPPKRYR